MAQRLHVAQSAVSNQIARLERELDVRLLGLEPPMEAGQVDDAVGEGG